MMRNLLLLPLLLSPLGYVAARGKKKHTPAPTSAPPTPAPTPDPNNPYNHTNMMPNTFVKEPLATKYTGKEKPKVDFYSFPSSDFSLQKAREVYPVAMRMGDTIDFTPHQVIVKGMTKPYPNCRRWDDGSPETARRNCDEHCMNFGRYCDVGTLQENWRQQQPAQGEPLGRALVEEAARRMCVWRDWGKNGAPLYFFRYLYIMKHTGCDKLLTDECIDNVLKTVGLDKHTITWCMDNLDPNLDEPNELLDKAIEAQVDVQADSKFWAQNDANHTYHNIPALFVNGYEKLDFEPDVEGLPETERTESVLEHVCRHFGPDHPHPHICGMCLHWCPKQAGEAFDMNTCLWELQCGNGSDRADYKFFKKHAKARMAHYYEEFEIPINFDAGFGVTTVAAAEPSEPASAPLPNDEEELPADQDDPLDEPINNKLDEEWTVDDDASLGPNTDDDDLAPDGMSAAAKFGLVCLVIAIIVLSGMGIKAWRTKVIVDRYVRTMKQTDELGPAYKDDSDGFDVDAISDPAPYRDDSNRSEDSLSDLPVPKMQLV